LKSATSQRRETLLWAPVALAVGASCFLALSVLRLNEDNEDVHACGVDDVKRFIPADVQKSAPLDD
jgi:hypothetical protein